MYEQQKATYAEINECLALWKLRHTQFMTTRDDPRRPVSYWMRRQDTYFTLDNPVHSYNCGLPKPKEGGISFDSRHLEDFVVKVEVQRLWPRLKLGEGKAENQNNMIIALMGEVVNLLDMNQDAYYSEGLKLPLITPMFLGRRRLQLYTDSGSTDARQGARRGSADRHRMTHVARYDYVYACVRLWTFVHASAPPTPVPVYGLCKPTVCSLLSQRTRLGACICLSAPQSVHKQP